MLRFRSNEWATVLHTALATALLDGHVFVAQGNRCPEAYVEAAKRAADGLARYENAAALSSIVAQGAEPPGLRDALSLPEGFGAQENRAYDADYAVRPPVPSLGRLCSQWLMH